MTITVWESVNMLQTDNSHATVFWSKLHEVMDGQENISCNQKLYKCATCQVKITSHVG